MHLLGDLVVALLGASSDFSDRNFGVERDHRHQPGALRLVAAVQVDTRTSLASLQNLHHFLHVVLHFPAKFYILHARQNVYVNFTL